MGDLFKKALEKFARRFSAHLEGLMRGVYWNKSILDSILYEDVHAQSEKKYRSTLVGLNATV